MTKEKCWKCKKLVKGAKLRVSDDRLCELCHSEDEAALRKLRGGISPVASVTRSSASGVTSPASRTTSRPSNSHMVQSIGDNGFNPSNTANTADNTTTVDDLGSACAATCVVNSTVSQPAYIIELKQQITDMKSIIQQQQCHINQLSTRLKFVLSFLDIDSNENPMEQPYSPRNTVKSDNADAAHMTVKSMYTHGESSQQHVEQFKQSRQHPRANLRDAVASAVVEDQQMRERNAKSLIVTGFTSTSGSDSGCMSQDDLNSFCELCESELNLNLSRVKPKYCKRLGSAGSGKILPLLVAFETAEQVNTILSHAKKLRGSTNDTVRRNVYIN